MKTTEIAAFIAGKNIRLYVNSHRPFLPFLPNVVTQLGVGWVAFNLIACFEKCHEGDCLFVHREHGAFGIYRMEFGFEQLLPNGWEAVVWDGYGELESWKEVAG